MSLEESYVSEFLLRVLPSVFKLQVVLDIGAHSNPRRALKSVQEQEDRRYRRIEMTNLTCYRDSGTKERKFEKAEGEGSYKAPCSNC